MKFNIPVALTRTVSRQVLLTQKHSPTILFAAGIVGVVATTVSACKATLKVEEVLDEAQTKLNLSTNLEHKDYSERDRQKDKTLIYVQTAAKLCKLYAPALVLGTLSIASLTGSHRILTSRNAGLSAAYAAADKAFKEYRRRVVDEYGEEKDRELRYGVDEKVIVVEDKNGPKKKTIKVVGGGYSEYSRVFDEYNDNWTENPDYRIAFLRLQQNHLNDKLRARGHLFLNEAYEALGFEHTPAGSQVGWLWNKEQARDEFVDLGIWDDKSMQRFHAFAIGREDGIVLDFNVDGEIWRNI